MTRSRLGLGQGPFQILILIVLYLYTSRNRLQPSKLSLSLTMSIEQNELNDEHPLVLELSSLRQIAARFQVLFISYTFALTIHIR
jgi:hypothetical protein